MFRELEERFEYVVQDAVYPVGVDPEEDDDQGYAHDAADVDKLGRGFSSGHHFVEGEDYRSAVEGIYRKDVKYCQKQRQKRHRPTEIITVPAFRYNRHHKIVYDNESQYVQQHTGRRNHEPLPGWFVVDIRRSGSRFRWVIAFGSRPEHCHTAQRQQSQTPLDVTPRTAGVPSGLVRQEREEKHFHFLDAASKRQPGNHMAEFVDNDDNRQIQNER